jgi:hypothetical protein
MKSQPEILRDRSKQFAIQIELLKEANELLAIFSASNQTARGRR